MRWRLYFFVCLRASPALILIGSIACGGGSQNRAILAEASYSLTAAGLNPSSIMPGQTASSVVTLKSFNSYAGVVNLSCGVISASGPVPTCSFSVNPVKLSADGQATSSLTISTSANTAVGSYAISVNAEDASKTVANDGPQSLSLTISGRPSYLLNAASPSPSSITAGQDSTSSITVTSANGYAGTVNLSCAAIAGSGSVPSCSFNPNSLTLSPNAQATSMLTLSTTTSTPGGTYSVTIDALDDNQAAPANGPQTFTLTAAAIIQRVVIIFQENRTPDNLFQDPVLIARGADIAASGTDSSGQVIALAPIDLGTSGTSPQNYDLGHSHGDFNLMYDGGKMDGADKIVCYPLTNCSMVPHPQFMYVLPSDVLPYFSLAEQYTFADRMFQTNQGPSFPAHQFIISGTSAPTATSNLFAGENTEQNPAGCVAVPANRVVMVDPQGNESTVPSEYPCFEHPTLTDLLNSAGVTWRYYAPSIGSIWTAPNAIQHMCQPQTVNGVLTCTGSDWTQGVVLSPKQVLQDVGNGQLAQVSWVMPDGLFSDHAIANDGSGPSWVASIVNAIGNSQYWNNTAIIITWDDWGGWYDHVAPTIIRDGVSWGSGYVYGFRVPLIVVSPYAKAAYISHATHDFGSILKFVEKTFHLPSLGYADDFADDLSDCFIMTQSPLSFHAIASPVKADHFLNSTSPPTDPDDD